MDEKGVTEYLELINELQKEKIGNSKGPFE